MPCSARECPIVRDDRSPLWFLAKPVAAIFAPQEGKWDSKRERSAVDLRTILRLDRPESAKGLAAFDCARRAMDYPQATARHFDAPHAGSCLQVLAPNILAQMITLLGRFGALRPAIAAGAGGLVGRYSEGRHVSTRGRQANGRDRSQPGGGPPEKRHQQACRPRLIGEWSQEPSARWRRLSLQLWDATELATAGHRRLLGEGVFFPGAFFQDMIHSGMKRLPDAATCRRYSCAPGR